MFKEETKQSLRSWNKVGQRGTAGTEGDRWEGGDRWDRGDRWEGGGQVGQRGTGGTEGDRWDRYRLYLLLQKMHVLNVTRQCRCQGGSS